MCTCCGSRPVYIKRSGLCRRCYYRAYERFSAERELDELGTLAAMKHALEHCRMSVAARLRLKRALAEAQADESIPLRRHALAHVRYLAGVSRMELATGLGVSALMISRVEQGAYVEPMLIDRFACACTIEWISALRILRDSWKSETRRWYAICFAALHYRPVYHRRSIVSVDEVPHALEDVLSSARERWDKVFGEEGAP